MRLNDDPASMTADERLSEVGRILAGGVLRLHARAALACESSLDNLQKSSPERLEVPAETVLSVHLG